MPPEHLHPALRATGALAGAIAGIAAELGLGAASTGAIASGTGDAASQALITAHINPGHVAAAAALTGAALGYAGSKGVCGGISLGV